ncbi:MAG: transglycosylase SLT domain-containing protein [Actinomycetota bacterium]|nr:transglycosylase SLT domain-containing protein [Actinomycetota bacterium]
MGLPMRYPRFFIVLFVAFGLAALGAAPTHATGTGPSSGELRQVEAVSLVSRHASADGDLGRREGVVDMLAQRTDLDSREADLLLDAVTGLVEVVTGVGKRVGVLTSPEIDALLEAVLDLARSFDQQSDQAFAEADFVAEWETVAAEFPVEAQRTATDVMPPAEAVPVADPVEQWRPLVERYFSPERIEEALSIIDCESNGDPDARNPKSSASGLFQFLGRTWTHSSEQAGFQGESPFSPEANIATAAWLVEYSLDAGDSAWAHWSCRP